MWGLWFVMALMAAIEVPILKRQGLWGELWAFLGMWLLAGVFASLVVTRTMIPSIVMVISWIFRLPI
jgi:hypothetical protein